MREIVILRTEKPVVHVPLLDEELAAGLRLVSVGGVYGGVVTDLTRIRVLLADPAGPAQEAQARSIVAEHDPTQLSNAELQAEAEGERVARALDAARAIPGWATFSEAEAVEWIDTHITDLPTAKQALRAYAQLLIAIRDRLWPALG
jgi:hypothetical protein